MGARVAVDCGSVGGSSADMEIDVDGEVRIFTEDTVLGGGRGNRSV